MHLIRDTKTCPEHAKNAVIALGNFDGLHPGHLAVIHQAKAIADKHGLPSAVMSFEPHPIRFLHPSLPPFRLQRFRSKYLMLEQLGLDIFFCPRFNKRFSHLTGKDFIRSILHEQLAARHIVIGYDFIFGYKRSGDVNLLREFSQPLGYSLRQVSAQQNMDDMTYSSTLIREAIKSGHFGRASELLNYPFFYEDRIRYGAQKGRTINFPTVNLHLKGYQHPPHGVYAGYVELEGTRYQAAINIGVRPTVTREKRIVAEAHLFDFEGDVYGKWAKLYPRDFVRPEQPFDSLDRLKEQITEDCATIRKLLG